MTDVSKPRIAVLGGGSFGTVIANLAAGNGCEATLWMRDAELVAEGADSLPITDWKSRTIIG